MVASIVGCRWRPGSPSTTDRVGATMINRVSARGCARVVAVAIVSTPLRCFDTFDQAVSVLPPFPFPLTRAEENTQRIADNNLAAACARHGGPILEHMSTADVARDMDLLRQALGDRRLTYLGFS